MVVESWSVPLVTGTRWLKDNLFVDNVRRLSAQGEYSLYGHICRNTSWRINTVDGMALVGQAVHLPVNACNICHRSPTQLYPFQLQLLRAGDCYDGRVIKRSFGESQGMAEERLFLSNVRRLSAQGKENTVSVPGMLRGSVYFGHAYRSMLTPLLK